jgi:hypothetical protein
MKIKPFRPVGYVQLPIRNRMSSPATITAAQFGSSAEWPPVTGGAFDLAV